MNAIRQATDVLQRGGLILYPTDTVWGIGCDATRPQAVEKVYALKRRADHKSLILLVPGIEMIRRYIPQIPPIAYSLIESATEPLTVIYPQSTGLPANVRAVDGSVAMRIVRHDGCLQLLAHIDRPLVSTSANLSGRPTPTTFSHISDEIKSGCDYILPERYEGSPTRCPSTLIKVNLEGDVEILR